MSEQVDTKSLDPLVAWMRDLGVVALKTPTIELVLGPEPGPKPSRTTQEPEDPELRGERLKKEAREEMRERMSLATPQIRYSNDELDRMAARELGLVLDVPG